MHKATATATAAAMHAAEPQAPINTAAVAAAAATAGLLAQHQYDFSAAARTVFWSDFVAGCVGGSAGIVTGYPLDTIKVLQQTMKRSTARSKTALRTAYDVLCKDGPRRLYSGMSFPMVTEGIRCSIFFGIYGNILGLDERSPSNRLKPLEVAMAAGVAGGLQGFLATPVELVKIQMQSSKGASSVSGPVQCVRYIVKSGNGPAALFRGGTITICREVPALSAYMTTYSVLRNMATPADRRDPPLVVDFLIGGMAGASSWLTTIPLDVIKTRIQSDAIGEGRRYEPGLAGIVRCAVDSWTTEGARVFWRGSGATCLRAFPTNAITLVVYSKTLSMIQDKASVRKERVSTLPPPSVSL